MLFSLFILIQSQEPPRLSKVVIAGVAIFLILGVYLLVYFIRRLKSGEKEPEEDWSLSRRSLFVEESAPSESSTEEAATPEPPQAEEVKPATRILASPYSSQASGQTRSLVSEPVLEEPPAPSQPEPEPEPSAEAPLVSAPPDHRAGEAGGTAFLASPQLETPAQVKSRETMPFDEEIRSKIETKDQESSSPVEPAAPRQTTELRSPSIEHERDVQREEAEPEQVARVEQRATREFFVPPRIEQVTQREPFEPPTIKRLTPREQAEVRDQQAARRVTRDLNAGSSQGEDMTNRPALDAATERQPSTFYEPRGTRELAADPGLSSSIGPAPAGDRLEPSITASPSNRAQERRAPAGAVLGLPLEGARGPMVLGRPVRSADEIGIGSLSGYGKPLEKEGGRGGTIALLLAILIVGGGLAVYFFVPPVHSQVNAWVARMRGVDPNAANQSTEPKAMIFPFPSLPDKNMVKAKGTINNISAETLENLELEVSLERANATSEVRNFAITPSQIEPNGRGTYEFEYDGNRETGFIVYKIKRLLSNGNPVRFTSPGQR